VHPPNQVQLTGVRDWRFNERAEDIEWLLQFSSPDGSIITSSWQILYSLTHPQQWQELQKFLIPRLHQLRSYCQTHCIQKPGVEPAQLFQPTPHAFKPWRRDYIIDWRYSRTKDQVRS
jgi:hypothetical protein